MNIILVILAKIFGTREESPIGEIYHWRGKYYLIAPHKVSYVTGKRIK